MARKVATGKTAEQRKAEADALHQRITDQVAGFTKSEEWLRYLDFAQRFHNYSLNNLILIMSQCPDATRVAGFRKWQELGRQVRKGEKAIKIFGFRERKVKEDEQLDDSQTDFNEDGETVVRYFPMLSVFDMSQTDPTEDWVDPTPAQLLTGEDEAGIFQATADFISSKGWTVKRKTIESGANGYTTIDGTKTIVICDTLSDAQAAKTMLHEAAHALMHADIDAAEYIEHRGIKECEAESVAYIVAGLLGLDTSSYSVGYVAGWVNHDPEALKQTAKNVLKTAHQIADAITDEAVAAQPLTAAA